MDEVLVTGGSGHLGTDVVRLLLERGERVRVLSRTPRTGTDVRTFEGDLATGRGIREAVSGVRAIVHAATLSPAARRGHFLPVDFVTSPPDVDVHGTQELLDEAQRAGVEHILHVSIVGVQQSKVPYLRRKAEAENIVRSSAVPWTILPATPFFWLLARFHDPMRKQRVWVAPRCLVLPSGQAVRKPAPTVSWEQPPGPSGSRSTEAWKTKSPCQGDPARALGASCFIVGRSQAAVKGSGQQRRFQLLQAAQ